MDNKKTDINETLEVYQKLGITSEKFPPYTDPYSFAQRFKKCSIYSEEYTYTYSSSSFMQTSDIGNLKNA